MQSLPRLRFALSRMRHARGPWRRATATVLLAAALGATHGTAPAQSATPEVKRQGNVDYLSGDLGLEQSEAAAQGRYNLGLTFVVKGGEFLGEVQVTITSRQDATVLDVRSDGPRMLVRLPPDHYRVVASFAGRSVTREAEVGAGERVELQFLWPIDDSVARRPL